MVLNKASSQQYTVNIVSRDNTARGTYFDMYDGYVCYVFCYYLAGSDYGTSTGIQMYSVTFSAGSTVQSFSINTISDSIWEFNETFSLIIQPSSTLGLAIANPRESEVTIIDITGS